MIQSTMSIEGLYNYDNSVMDNFIVPEGINRNLCLQRVIDEAGNFELVYPSAIIMRNRIGIWCATRMPVWEKLYETTQFDYNPIENYNRHEIWHDNGKRQNTTKNNSTINVSHDGSENSNTTDTGNGTTAGTSTSANTDVMQKWGFNSDVPANAQQNTVSGNGTTKNDTDYSNTIHNEHSFNSSDKTTHGGDISENGTDDTWHDGHLFGNIGVTTTQQMIKEQREIVEFNIIEYIVQDFIKEFCVMLY